MCVACLQGDSGGPLACASSGSNVWHLYGVTSWGDGCGIKNHPGVYVRMSKFVGWIKQKMKGNNNTNKNTRLMCPFPATTSPNDTSHCDLLFCS